MDHSVRGYLERQSTEQLKGILRACTEGNLQKEYAYAIPLILEVLEKRKKKTQDGCIGK